MYGRQYDNLPQLQDTDSMRGSVIDRGSVPPYTQYSNGSNYGELIICSSVVCDKALTPFLNYCFFA